MEAVADRSYSVSLDRNQWVMLLKPCNTILTFLKTKFDLMDVMTALHCYFLISYLIVWTLDHIE